MRTRCLCAALVVLLLALPAGAAPAPAVVPTPTMTVGTVLFIANAGQFPPAVRFVVYGGGQPLWLSDEGLGIGPAGAGAAPDVPFPTAARVEPLGRPTTRVHFYPGPDPVAWRADVPAYGGVRCRGIAPGVDLEITAVDRRLTWRLDCAGPCPADPLGLAGDPLLALPTAVAAPLLAAPVAPVGPVIPLDDPADLRAGTFLGSINDEGLDAVAWGPEGDLYVAGDTSAASGGFTGPLYLARFSPDLHTLRSITFLGSEAYGYDAVADMAVVGDSVYLVGTTYSRQFPVTPGAFDTVLNDGRPDNCPIGPSSLPCPDAFAVQLSAAGQLRYATYLGGAQKVVPGLGNQGGDDRGRGIGADASGDIYVVGTTDADDFPTTPGAFDRDFSYIDIGLNPDIFVVKLRPAGAGAADLLYGTYLGSGFVNTAGGMALANGVVYGTGCVEGEPNFVLEPKIDFPHTPGAYPGSYQCVGDDCQALFFFALAPQGQGAADLRYGTFFGGVTTGGGEIEGGDDLAVGADGTVYIVGYSNAPGFPTTPGALQETLPAAASPAATLVRLNPAGRGTADLLYGTYLGGAGMTWWSAIALDGVGEVYLAGQTSAPNLPYTRGALDSTLGGRLDAFLLHLSPQGQGSADLVYGSYLGGAGYDAARDIAVGGGTVYVVGYATSNDFPTTPGAYDPTWNGGDDGFIAQVAVTNAGRYRVYLSLVTRD